MITLLRFWNQAGGELPGGLLILLLLLLVWTWFLFRMLLPLGVLRGRHPLAWLLPGYLVLTGLHIGLRGLAGGLEQPASLALWPPDPDEDPHVYLLMLQAEAELRKDSSHPVRVLSGLLDDGRFQPVNTEGADRLLRALDCALLLTKHGDQFHLWERRWGVSDRLAVEDIDGDARGALIRLLRPYSKQLDPGAVDLRNLPLYTSFADSAGRWLDLPEGELELAPDLRRGRLQLELAPGSPDLVRAVNRGMAAEDSAGAEGWLLAARWFMQEEEWESCAQALTNALSIEPGHPEIHWLASFLGKEKRTALGYESKAAARARCLRLQILHLPALILQAQHWMDYRQGKLAVDAVDRALLAYPDHPELLLLRGNLAYQLMNHELARELYLRVTELRPQDVRVWQNLGQLLYVIHDYRAAIQPLRRAVELGSPPEMLHLLGVSYRMSGERELAIETLRRRMRLGGDRGELERTRRQLAVLFPEGVPDTTSGPRP